MQANSHPQAPAGSVPAQSEAQLRLLVETGLLLASERSLDVIVQAALDAGLHLCGAHFGAFFYSNTGSDGEAYQLYKLAGAAAEAFGGSALPPAALIGSAAFEDGKIFRSNDITVDSGGDPNPLAGLPDRKLPVRSYLTVPVRGRSGEVIGGILYGHPEPGRFTAESEALVATVAAQAAVAIDNARLAENLTREIAVTDAARTSQRETAERLERVFEATNDGIALMDRQWRFTYFNRRANEIVAQGRNLIGWHYYEVFPDARGSLFEQKYAEAMNHGRTVEFTDYYAPLDIWAAIRVFPTPDGIAIFFQDVTLQRRAERDRAAAESRLRQALDAAQLGTWSWDRATDLLDLDERAAELFYAEPHNPITRSVMRERIVSPQDRESTVDSLRASLVSGGLYRAEYRVHRPERPSDFRWIVSRGVPTYVEGSQQVTGMIGVIQDVTDRISQEVTLRQSEKLAATGRLAATIAHEINNPLEAVTNLIYLAKTDPEIPSAVQRLLETADAELVRVSQIAQQTLGFYRDTTRPVDINLNELLSSVVDLFSRKLVYSRVTCSLDLESDLCIFGLQGEIRQVFSNLLVNAIDASQSNSQTGTGPRNIRIRAHRHHDGREGVAVLVCDSGSGIAPAVREQLFAPFVTTKPSLGTGLGLWVTRGIVEKHGGTVTFRTSTQPPTGTIFRIFLPLKIANPEVFSSPQSSVIQ
jgi:signal transduction histidine kinase